MVQFVPVFSFRSYGPRQERRKMNYTEFVCAVEKSMSLKMEEGVKVSSYTAVKNNGRERKGIIVETPGVNISPTIYLEEYYQCYQSGEKLEEIVEDISSFYESIRKEESWDYKKILSYEGVKDRIVFKLVNTKKNRDFLDTVPHRDILDLSVVFYVLLEVSREGAAMMTICENHLRQWGIDSDVLRKTAEENVKRILPAELFTMRHALSEIVRSAENGCADTENLLAQGGGERDRMYVLTNRIRSYGAACIAYPYIPGMIGKTLGSDYYILPSSVHEVMIVPACSSPGGEELEEMVREINATQVAEEEVLSDHIYYYDCSEDQIRMFGADESRREGAR